jgi:hypothetical protein
VGTSSTATISVQSSGLSLLSPNLTVYAADTITVLGSASGAGQYGTTLTVTLTGVTAGQQVYIKVTGADTTAFGTGAYALTLNYGTGAAPTVPLPNTQTGNGDPLSSGGGSPQIPGDGQEHDGVDTYDPNNQAVVSRGQEPQVLLVQLEVSQAPVVGQPAVSLRDVDAGRFFTRAFTATPVLSLPTTFVALALPTVSPVSIASDAEESPATSVDACAAEAVLSVAPSMRLASPTRETDLGTVLRREECDACFADESWLDSSDGGVEALFSGGTEGVGATDAAAMAGLLVVLGGYWRGQPEECSRYGRRGFLA